MISQHDPSLSPGMRTGSNFGTFSGVSTVTTGHVETPHWTDDDERWRMDVWVPTTARRVVPCDRY
jgi:hypothetical protein